MGELSKKFLIESIWKTASTILTKSGSIIFVVIIAHFLKPEGFGVYNLAMSIVLTLAILTDVGINSTLLRYFSNALAEGRKDLAASYFSYLFRLKLILISIVSPLLLILSWPLAFFVFKKPELFIPLAILSFYLAILSLENFFEYLMYALQKVKYLFVREILFQTVKIILALLVFFILTEKFYVNGVILSLLFSQFGIVLFFLIVLMKNYSFIFKRQDIEVDKKRVWSFMKYLSIGGLSTMLFAYVDVIMLGIFLPSEYVGYYSAAISLFGTFAALMALSNLLVPIFVQLNFDQIKNSFDKLFKYICMFSIPLTFGVLALGKYLVVLLYGYEYLPAKIPLYFFAPLIFSGIIIETIISLFSAKEKPQYFVKMLLISAFLNIFLNLVLITTLSKISFELAMAGAAVATLITRYFYMFSIGFSAKKILGISFKSSYFIKPLFSGGFMFFCIFLINSYSVGMTIQKGIGEIFFGIIIYFVILFFIKGVGESEIIPLQLFLKKKYLKEEFHNFKDGK